MSVLDELVAGAVEDQRSRENNVPLAEVKRMAFEASAPIDARQWLKKGGWHSGHRRDQACLPIQRPFERYSGSGRFGPRIRAGRCKRDFRAD